MSTRNRRIRSRRGGIEADHVTRDPFRKECGEEYAQVVNMVRDDDNICIAGCFDGFTRKCYISDELLNTVGVYFGDILLVRPHKKKKKRSKRSADVILKFMPEEAMLLRAHGVLPEDILLNKGIGGGMESEKIEKLTYEDYHNYEYKEEDIYTI